MRKEEDIDYSKARCSINEDIHIARKIRKHWVDRYSWRVGTSSLVQLGNLRCQRGYVVKVNQPVEVFYYDVPGVFNATVDDALNITVVPDAGVTLAEEELKAAHIEIRKKYDTFTKDCEQVEFFVKKIPNVLHGLSIQGALDKIKELGYGEPEKRRECYTEDSDEDSE